MKFNKNDEAVSPVIGVILMVAITVILAAVIAAFVFGMAGNIGQTKSVAATASQTVDTTGGYTTTVTYQGGKDMADVGMLSGSVTSGETGTKTAFTWDPVMPATPTAPIAVGTIGTVADGSQQKDHVVVTATFVDGSEQVILDTYV